MSSSKSKSSHKSSRSSYSCYQSQVSQPSLPVSGFENEFYQFYAELHKSAVLYSDKDFQQRVLYGYGLESPYSQPLAPIIPSPKDSKTPQSGSKVRHGSKKDVPVIATSSVRRKVSFSKHSPRLNLITPTPPALLSPARSTCNNNNNNNNGLEEFVNETEPSEMPRITVEEQTNSSCSCWSSDLEESDTTETERATSDKDSDTSDFKQIPVKLGMKPPPVQLVAPEGKNSVGIAVETDFEISKIESDVAKDVVDLEGGSDEVTGNNLVTEVDVDSQILSIGEGDTKNQSSA